MSCLLNTLLNSRAVSPVGSTHVLDIKGLKDPTIKFWSFWENDTISGLWGFEIFR